MHGFEPASIDVGVDLCSGQIGMAQEFLHHPQIGPPLKQVGGKTVPQHVRMHVAKPRRFGPFADDQPHRGPVQGEPLGREKKATLILAGHRREQRANVLEIGIDGLAGRLANRDRSVFAAFSVEQNVPFIGSVPSQLRGTYLAGAQPTGVHQFEYGPVAEPELGFPLDGSAFRSGGGDQSAHLPG